jgi:hypothetical protein
VRQSVRQAGSRVLKSTRKVRHAADRQNRLVLVARRPCLSRQRGHSLRGGPLTGPRAFFGARFLIILSGKRARIDQQQPNGPADRAAQAIYAESGPPDPAAQDGGNCICVASATFFAADYRRCRSSGRRRTALTTSGPPNSVVGCTWGLSWTRFGAYRGYFCLTDELRSTRSAVARGKAVGWPLPRPGSAHTLLLPRFCVTKDPGMPFLCQFGHGRR